MKITFVTFHNWETKRVGGFHKFAEACSLAGHEVVFFSYDRPYFIYFKNEERLNKNVLKNLIRGKIYKLNNSDSTKIINCTWPTLTLPMPLRKWAPKKFNEWCSRHSFTSFKKFSNIFLKDTSVFVFESCSGLRLYDKIRTEFPNAKYVYRPSDPLMVKGATQETVELETKCLLESDLTFIVNIQGLELYKKNIKDFEHRVKYEILSNGVDLEAFYRNYPVPQALQQKRTALYVGARKAEWPLLLEAAKKCPDIYFVIICPETPSKDFLESNLHNINYIKGIPPKEVPAYVTNCDVVIIPNPEGLYKIKPWGVTAKYYQAMAAGKPIVAYEDADDLISLGISVSHNYADFIESLCHTFQYLNGKVNYPSLSEKDWKRITGHFISKIESL